MSALRNILASEGLLSHIEIRIPYASPDGSPVDPRWVMDLGPRGMFADKLDLRPDARAVLKKCLKKQIRPTWKGPPSPKIDGIMIFENVPERVKNEVLEGSKWYGIKDTITVRPA